MIFNNYKITPDVSDDEVLKNILAFITDVQFYAPVIEFAKAWPHSNEPNPWDGPHKGEASHVLDIEFLLQNFNDHLGPEQQGTAQRLAQDIITLVNGQDPYPLHDQENRGAKFYRPPADPRVKYAQSKERGRLWP